MADILVQFPALVRIGVFPRGAQVRAMVGASRNPVSSRKPKWAPSRTVFFYAGPHMLFPVPDRFLVSLPVAWTGFLATPSHLPHQSPHIGDGVADREFSTDDIPDAPQRPQVGSVPRFQWPLQEQPCQLLLLPVAQQGGSPGGGFDTESTFALPAE
jgi:hypothetical protein